MHMSSRSLFEQATATLEGLHTAAEGEAAFVVH